MFVPASERSALLISKLLQGEVQLVGLEAMTQSQSLLINHLLKTLQARQSLLVKRQGASSGFSERTANA